MYSSLYSPFPGGCSNLLWRNRKRKGMVQSTLFRPRGNLAVPLYRILRAKNDLSVPEFGHGFLPSGLKRFGCTSCHTLSYP
jgi:hypothetical protein